MGLNLLNNNKSLDVLHNLRNYNEDENNPFSEVNVDSLFYDEETFTSKFKNSNKPIFLNLNVQSLMSKFDKLKNFILKLTNTGIQIDVIAMQEIWSVKYPSLLVLPGFQQAILKMRKKGSGGGVGFFIRNGLNFKVVDTQVGFHDKLFESLSVNISYSNKRTITASCCYRSPTQVTGYTQTQQYEFFTDRVDRLMHELSLKNHDSYIFLDSNINLFELGKSEVVNQYLFTMYDRGFLPVNFKATRMNGTSNTLIDHILTNSKTSNLTSGSIIEDISDHWVTFLQPNISKCKSKPEKIKKRLINRETLERFKNNLKNVSWDNVTACTDTDDCYNKFWTLYTELYDLHFPWVTVNFNRNVHKISNFMTQGLLVSRRTKIELLKTSLTNPSATNRTKFKLYRNVFNSLVRASKKMHIDNELKRNAKKPKKIWDTLKELTIGKKQNQKIVTINSKNAEPLTDPVLIAEEFNDFFSQAGKKVAESVEPISKGPLEFLPPTETEPPNLQIREISQGDLINIIDCMEPKGSQDLNEMSSKMIKYLKYELATPLVHLFNLSIRHGVFPSKLKASRTVPIFKSGDPNNCDNYRPISLQSSISKLLEKFIANQLVDHLEVNKLLYEHQYGFQRNKSTLHSLTQLTNFVTKELNEKKFVVGVFLDLKKAFDVVSHNILLSKLEKLGIKDGTLKWFTSYLAGRTQRVDINGHLSGEKTIDISVLQGSILGPILFLCFINDLPNITTLLTILFADDTAGLKSGHDLNALIRDVNAEIKKLANWFRSNRMAVNVNKTKYIIFKPKGVKINIGDDEGIIYDENEIGQPIDPNKIKKLDRIYSDSPDLQNRTYKLLGVLLDEHLSFDAHCNYVCTKIAQSNFIINRAKHFLPHNSLRTLYFALIHPHLLYCLPIYSCTTTSNINKIEKMQKKAIRIITKSNYTAHTTPLFNSLKIMPLKHLISYTQSLLVHSIYHKYSPPSLHNTWVTNGMRNNQHDLRNANDLYIPLARTEQVKRLPYFHLPKIWNELYEQKYTPNPTTFKIAIKEYYLSLTNPVENEAQY